MFGPKKFKFNKHHKSSKKKIEKTLFFVKRYEKKTLSLIALDNFYLLNSHINSAMAFMLRALKVYNSIIEIGLFSNLVITKKPQSVRMGKGKGNFFSWYAPVKKGTVIFQIYGFNVKKMETTLLLGAKKLPFKTKITKPLFNKNVNC